MAIESVYLTLFSVVCVAATVAVASESASRDVTYEDVLRITKDPEVLLVDVRTPDEVAETGIIPSAINVPLADFREVLSNKSTESFLQQYHRDKPNPDSQIVIYCTLGGRAQQALDAALQLGYKNAKRYPGSWKEWSEKQKADAESDEIS